MSNSLTLGSLFDGSGAFPMAGLLSGITPIWASEIEPFPIAVTRKRLPFMKHYGDISKLNGGNLPPVDIITFGSPCTDLSAAGKRQGLHAERSGLFFQAIRIIKEMRCATHGKYPRFIVFENVPGLFSSNSGEDFRTVLASICQIKDASLSIPKPAKWTKAGEIVADNFSLAWRTLDAQYWGVPQRRKRIYLVTDFDGECTGQILFESEGVSGYSAEGFRAWQKAARCFADCAGTTGGTGLMFENHSQDTRYTSPLEVAQTVSATYGTGGNNQPFVVNSARVYGICSKHSHSMLSDNPNSGFYEANTSRTIDTSNQSPCKNQGGMVVVEGNGSRPSHKGDGYKESDTMYTLNCTENHAVSYGIGRPAMNQGYNSGFSFQIEEETSPTLVAAGAGGVSHPRALPHPMCTPDSSPEIEYIVRRLTPQECALLQGMPIWWCDDLGIENPTEEELAFWRQVFEEHRLATNPNKRPKTNKQIRKWLKNPYSDSAAYKMWGNGIFMGNAWFVLAGIAHFADTQE